MELGPLVRGVSQIPKAAARIPFNVAEKVGDYGVSVFTQSLELLAPSMTTKEFVDDLKKHQPIKDAHIGINAKLHGEAKDDPALEFTGGAMAVNAIVKALEDPEVPARITESIVHDVSEAGIVPEEVPLVSDEVVDKAQTAIKKYGHAVVNIFPGRQNKL